MTATVKKRTWRERRGEDWSETLYEGLLLEYNSKKFLISKLSHGLRVLEMKSADHYLFESESEVEIELSKAFMSQIITTYAADMALQTHLGEYEAMIGKVDQK